MKVLVTGATGYIGGRLVPRLLDRGHSVRVLVRDPGRIAGRPWAGRVEVAAGDLLDAATLEPALAGIEAAYYLVHSMDAGHDFGERDRTAAGNFVEAARKAGGIGHLLYLGGLQPAGSDVSEHLRSRAEVGEILRADCPPPSCGPGRSSARDRLRSRWCAT